MFKARVALSMGFLWLCGCSTGPDGYTASDKDMTPYVLKVSGDGQALPAGQVAPVRFSVQLKMDVGQITSWELHRVTISAPSSGAGGTFLDDGEPNVFISEGMHGATIHSGPSGLITFPRFQANDIAGSYEVTVVAFPTYYPDKPGTIKFTVTNQ